MTSLTENFHQETYCTTREAAEMLQVSLRTVQLWVESGTLRAWKTDGGHRRLALSSINEVLQQRLHNLQPAIKTAGNEDPDNYQILVLEDEPDLLKLYRLTMAGWQLPIEVTFVSSVFEALVVIGRSNPDMLITDLKMPDVDGFAIIRLLRKDPELKNLKIIAVTGLDPDEIKKQGDLPEGITTFNKPIPFEQLHGYIKACLALRDNETT